MSKRIPPLSFRLSETQKNKANKIIENVMSERDIVKGDALEYILDKYNDMLLNGKVSPDEYIPPNIQDVILSVECDYIEYLDETFYCLEKYHKSKKKDELGTDPDEVKRLCLACKQGKAHIIEDKIRNERRKESFKRIENFLKQFMTITEKGFIAETYMCICDAIEGNLIYSRDGKTIQCPLIDNDIVQIKDTCMTALNPKTGLPPCHYLVTLEHLVQLSKEDIESMDIILPEIDYIEQPEPSSSTLRKEHRVKVEADFEIKEEIEDDETKTEVEK